MLQEVWVPGILASDSPGSLVEESTVSLTATKGVQTPGSPISSVTKPATSCPVGLMLVTVDKVCLLPWKRQEQGANSTNEKHSVVVIVESNFQMGKKWEISH